MKKLFVLLAFIALGSSYSFTQTDVRTTKGTDISQDHVFLKIVQGIEISYSKTLVNGTEVFNLHFRNRSTVSQLFTWELTSSTRAKYLSPAPISLASDGFHTSNGIFKMSADFDISQYELVLTFN